MYILDLNNLSSYVPLIKIIKEAIKNRKILIFNFNLWSHKINWTFMRAFFKYNVWFKKKVTHLLLYTEANV